MTVCIMIKLLSLYSIVRRLLNSSLFPYTTLFRSHEPHGSGIDRQALAGAHESGIRSGHSLLVNQIYRSEEHTSELQSRFDLVCRLLLEKKKMIKLLSRKPTALRLVNSSAAKMKIF